MKVPPVLFDAATVVERVFNLLKNIFIYNIYLLLRFIYALPMG